MTLDIHNWSSSARQEIHKIVKDEISPIVNQVDARVQNFEIQFLKEAAKFVRHFQSLANEADEYLAKHRALELEIERLLRAVISQDIMSIVQNNSVVDTSNLQTEPDQCKYDKISYDKAYNDMQQKIERLQDQLGDLKGICKDTPCVSDTLDPLPQKLENENVELELQIKLHDTIYENAKLRAQLFDKVSDQKDTSKGTSTNAKFANQSTKRKPFLQSLRNQFAVRQPNAFQSERPNFSKTRIPQKADKTHDLINPHQNFRKDNFVPNKPSKASVRTNPITASQSHVIIKKVVNADSNGFYSTRVDITTKTRRPQPRSNTKNDKVPSTSKSSRIINKEVEVEDHPRNLLLSKNKKHMSSECNNIKLAIRNDKSEIVCAMCFGDLQWGNILITRVYFVEGLKHNLFSVGQFCDSDLEVAFRRNICFIRNLEGVDLLKGNGTTNLYTINLHDMASASPICLMARATSTKSWLWHQRLSHLNFDTINDLARNDLVTCLPKFKYHKEHLCPSCEQRKSKRASHPPKPVLNSKKRLHLLHMNLCGPMRIASINGKRYVLVIVDDCSRYTWVVFLRSKGEAPEEIKNFLKRIIVLLQAPVVIVRIDNGIEFKNQVLQEYFKSVGITHQASYAEAIATACYTQNCSIIHFRFDKTPYELINGRKPDISFLHVFGALCYPKNDREDIGKLGAKGDIVFFIGYSANSCAYRVYNRRTKKIMETMNVTFDEISTMAFEQSSGQPSATPRTILAAQAPQILQTLTNVDELETQQQHGQPHPASTTDNVPNAMFDNNTFVNPFATPSTSFIDADHPSHVYKLKKALYGLKQAPRALYDELSTFLLQNYFFKGTIDPTLFIRRFDDDILVVHVYVDDIIFGSTHPRMDSCDPVGTLMEIKDKLDLDQHGSLVDAMKYRSMIGALMYLTSSRPDIVHATCLCARYQAKPTEKHLKEVKRIFRYLWGIVNTGLWYTKDSGFELTGFSNADYAGCKDTFKSTSSGVQFLGKKLVSCPWMRTQLTDYGFHFNKNPIYCDSKSAIAISYNPVQHSRTKHITIRYHFIKEHVEKGTIELYFVKTDYQLADLFTKALLVDRFNYLVRHLGMRSLSPQKLDHLAKSQ
ncbi:retrovirus-related pol polyprotein from transposon TNT 1-94 [Tanacetum coccineum]|uniref:Retrovirus-related pol polyprotein from transposon TNT 1-94 n=1 Tax=Tanacetum coccineum TaxID=301880 RepID=A0ABQ5B3N3_9ASTR